LATAAAEKVGRAVERSKEDAKEKGEAREPGKTRTGEN